MIEKMTDTKQILNFICAGKAIFTIKSATSGKHWTFKATPKDDVLFIHLKCGDEYLYIGYIKWNTYKISPKSCRQKDDAAHNVLRYLWDYIKKGELHPKFEFYHEGQCARCGRPLTDPESIKRGLGPTCASRC